MSSDEDCILTVEEVETALREIENKYSPNCSDRNGLDKNLSTLSMEYDSVGLSTLDLSMPKINIFQQVVSSARSLIQIHRKTLSQIKDVNIDNQCKSSKSNELYKLLDDYKSKLEKYEEKNHVLKKRINLMSDEHSMWKKQEDILKNEMERNKRFHASQQNELIMHIKKLKRENQRLREMMATEVGVYHSNDEVTLKLLGKYKRNEEIYKNTIQKLQDNNKELLKEVLDLREELALTTTGKADI
ncbi:hypothetical protein JTB14_012434 [Gonioctena quinquepunctata]|nr:hypothetical protein JTB14_012434 [Gonioctena quinquepunctata]